MSGSPAKPTNFQNPFIGPLFQGPYNHAGTAAVVEGNRTVNCEISAPYADTWAARDVVIRNNYSLESAAMGTASTSLESASAQRMFLGGFA